MIKLFWNTHNQRKPDLDDKTSQEAKDYVWGLYHKDNSDKWIYEVLGGIEFKLIKNQNEINNGDVLIVVDSSIQKKNELYTKLSLICSKIFLIHLGDESGGHDLTLTYSKFNFVWRAFCSNKYFNNNKISCLPIGYKTGTLRKKIADRKNKWAFIGTPHKSSRHDLLFQLSDIKPSFSFKTKKFNEKIMGIDEMSEILSSTEFIPCPNGFVHPETYRLYEALECGCIPIVENTYKYYDRLFPNNPFLKIDKWIEAKELMQNWKSHKIKQKGEECTVWWTNKKKEIQENINKKIYL